VDNSLLRREDDLNGEPHFMMLETIREYALVRLDAQGDRTFMRNQHLQYLLAFAERAEPQVRGHGQVEWLRHLDAEYPNFRAALEWSLNGGERVEGIRLATMLTVFWHHRSLFHEGYHWWQHLLRSGASMAGAVGTRVWAAAAWMTILSGAPVAAAVTLADQAIMVGRATGETADLALALGLRSFVEADVARHLELAREGLKLAHQAGEPWTIATTLLFWGSALMYSGDDPEALTEVWQEVLTRFRALGDRWGIGFAAGALAGIAADQQRYDEAVALYEEQLEMDEAFGHTSGAAYTLRNLADIAMACGEYARAAALLTESLGLVRRGGHGQWATDEWVLLGLERLAEVARLQGQASRAVRLWGATGHRRQEFEAARAPAIIPDAVSTLRTTLGDEAVTAAWAEGRAMSLEQAIAYALEDVSDG